ncbi:peptide-methionine (S)-S-oxide reductase [Zobellella sp. CGMCC 1.18722]|uniref:Peptide methionine sulfoxide reductase MsrA n=1 Tax=Zobellella iuensis TaxID=2803811 RepID=A0ABS1QNK7_9GAMM|nr:peptide-methionine (S)-S-oxide reductase [Zobellella iuensis]
MLLGLLLLAPKAWATQAVFAGGSFWVMESLFADRPGIERIEAGWMQSGSQHQRRQVVRVDYDDNLIGYGDLLTLYWAAVDAFDKEGQFCDRGAEFSPALYVQSSLQQKWAQQSRAKLELESGREIGVRILPVGAFALGLPRHQQYAKRSPLLYAAYRRACGYPAGEGLKPDELAGVLPPAIVR